MHLRGRIRVQMRNNDGSPCNPEFETREAIMRHVAAKIPQLKSRQNKPSGESYYQAPSQSQQAQHTTGGGGGKKGKGKRR